MRGFSCFTVRRDTRTIEGPIRALVLAALVTTATQAPAAVAQNAPTAQWTPSDFADLEDGQFYCPETLPTLAEKRQEMERFLVWTKAHHPNWTLAQITAFRVAVLENKGCTKTLENIRGESR